MMTKTRTAENIVRSHESIVRAYERDFRKRLRGTKLAKESVGGNTWLVPGAPVTSALFEVDFGGGNWQKFDYVKFRSWSAARRINRKIYNGRTYYTLSTKISRPTELSHA